MPRARAHHTTDILRVAPLPLGPSRVPACAPRSWRFPMSRTQIKRVLVLAVAGCTFAGRPARAQSAYSSATGIFGQHDNKRQYFDFNVGTTTIGTFRTWSWS